MKVDENLSTDEKKRLLLEKLKSSRSAEIAIIGVGCSFPGGVTDLESFWSLLDNKVDAITEVPKDRWDLDEYFDADQDRVGTMYTRWGGFINDIMEFDPAFFQISPREARTMDPQQRLSLEVSWKALESAGLVPSKLINTKTGVYMGATTTDYAQMIIKTGDRALIDRYFPGGTVLNAIAGRISFFYGFRGPSMVIDAACASSLVAVDLACQALRSGEVELALAGGVNAVLIPEGNVATSQGKMMSPSGRCKTFDQHADGYVRSDGCGIIVLKRLADALASGDPILGVIHASHVAQDGASSSLTTPNGEAQQTLIQECIQKARLQPKDIDYIEAHGTGTPLGDPIELDTIKDVFQSTREPGRPLVVGALKSNIGHCESAAGIAGLIKVLLCLKHNQFTANKHFHQLNSKASVNSSILIPVEELSWPRTEERPRFACVSSFGFSGTIAHLVLGDAPKAAPRSQSLSEGSDVIRVSAKTPAALAWSCRAHAERLSRISDTQLRDYSHSSLKGREQMEFHATAFGKSTDEIAEQLQQFSVTRAQGSLAPIKDTALLFTGQGSQYRSMGRDLYLCEPIFKAELDAIEEIYKDAYGTSLLAAMFSDSDDQLDQPASTQPAIFALEYALYKLYQAYGVNAAIVMGHSLGEYVAATAAGCMQLDEAVRLVARRGQLCESAAILGAMTVITLAEPEVEIYLKRLDGDLAIACTNSSHSTVVSGSIGSIARLEVWLSEASVPFQRLHSRQAYHSPLMQNITDAFKAALDEVSFKEPRIPIISNLTGKIHTSFDADYWIQHLLSTVRFDASLATLAEQGPLHVLEIGPMPHLLPHVTNLSQRFGKLVPTLKKGRNAYEMFKKSLVTLDNSGVNIDWTRYDSSYRYERLPMPHYGFEKSRYSLPFSSRVSPVKSPAAYPGQRIDVATEKGFIIQTSYQSASPSFLDDHRLHGKVVVPASSHISLILTVARRELPDWNAFLFKDFYFPEALVIDDGGIHTLQLVFESLSSERFEIRIFSKREGAESDRWILHGSGTLEKGEVSRVAASPQELTGSRLSGDTFYAKLRDKHYHLGPQLRWVQEITAAERKSLSILRSPEDADEDEQYFLHPGLIDSWFQTSAEAIGATRSLKGTSIPIGFEELLISASPRQTMECLATITNSDDFDADSMKVNLAIATRDRLPVATVKSLRFRLAEEHHFEKKRKSNALWQWQWSALKKNAAEAGKGQPSSIVIPCDPGSQAFVAQASVEYAGAPMRWVDPGRDALAQVLEIFEKHPADHHHLVLVLPDNPDPGDSALYENISLFLLPIMQAVSKRSEQQSTSLSLLARRISQGSWPDGFEPFRAQFRVFVNESPSAAGIFLQSDDAGRGLRFLLSQSFPLPAEKFMALDGKDEVQGLKLVRLPPPSQTPIKFRPDRTYIITGGNGSIGRLLLDFLLRRGAGHICVLSRSAPQQDFGPTKSITALACDVADAKDLRRALSHVRQTMPEIAGVFHLSGVIDDHTLANQSSRSMSRTFHPKATGAFNLHQEFLETPLDHFVLFSSLASTLGNRGQINYAVANGYLDALSAARHAKGLSGKSINWGPWAQTEMAADLKASLASRGISMIEDAEAAFELSLSVALPNFAYCEIDEVKLANRIALGVFASVTPAKKDPDVHDYQRLAALPREQRQADLATIVSIEVARAMGIESPTQLKRNLGLFQQGMDSLTAVDLCTGLGKRLGRRIPSVLVFDHPTIEKIAGFLNEEYFPLSTEPSDKPAQHVSFPMESKDPSADLDLKKLASKLDSLSKLEVYLGQ